MAQLAHSRQDNRYDYAYTPSPAPVVFAARGAPRLLLRLEALAVLVAAVLTYRSFGGGWAYFAWLFLVPDLSMLAYLAGARAGSVAYNVAHSYVGPALLAALGYALAFPECLLLVLIWVAHIGLDRALGYGLKYATGFGETHLGRIGRMGLPVTQPR
jgi:hypothetical protein